MLSGQHQGCTRDDVADVDGFWHHVWLSGISCIYECWKYRSASLHQLEAHVRFSHYSVRDKCPPCSSFMLPSCSPLFVGAQVFFAPESPRWYMTKNKYKQALNSLQRFRNSNLQAGRDLYYIHELLKVENQLKEGKHLWKEFFGRPRNRRAAQSSFFVMFMQ